MSSLFEMAKFSTFVILGLLCACVVADTEGNDKDEEHSDEMMLHIMGLADEIIQEGGDPIDILEEALAKLKGPKPKRSPSDTASSLHHDYELEHDDHTEQGHEIHRTSSHLSSIIETHTSSSEPEPAALLSLPSKDDMEDGIEMTPSSLLSKLTETKSESTTTVTMAPPITTTTTAASAPRSIVISSGIELPPLKLTESNSKDNLAIVPVTTQTTNDKAPDAPKAAMVSIVEERGPKLESEPLVGSSSMMSSEAVAPSVSASHVTDQTAHPPTTVFNHDDHYLPKNEHYEDEYIDESDPNDPKLVQIKKKVRNEVGPNGSIQEHHESHSSTSLGNNPNSFSRSSSSSSSSTSRSSSRSINSFSNYSGGHPTTVSDTIVTTDERPPKRQKHKNHPFGNHQQPPFGGYPNVPMLPQMPFMPPMPPMPPMMPYGMGWPNFYGGHTFGSFGKQPAGGFAHAGPGGAAAYASAFAGGMPDYYGFQSDDKADRKRRHAARHLNLDASKKKARKLGYRKSSEGYWTV